MPMIRIECIPTIRRDTCDACNDLSRDRKIKNEFEGKLFFYCVRKIYSTKTFEDNQTMTYI